MVIVTVSGISIEEISNETRLAEHCNYRALSKGLTNPLNCSLEILVAESAGKSSSRQQTDNISLGDAALIVKPLDSIKIDRVSEVEDAHDHQILRPPTIIAQLNVKVGSYLLLLLQRDPILLSKSIHYLLIEIRHGLAFEGDSMSCLDHIQIVVEHSAGAPLSPRLHSRRRMISHDSVEFNTGTFISILPNTKHPWSLNLGYCTPSEGVMEC